MPIFRINTQLHYFAHVPKCGGTAVEGYLQKRFGSIALREAVFAASDHPWNATSAEHIPAEWLARLIPPDWFSSSFAVVRHPWRRLVSAFFFARDVGKKIPPDGDFNAWVGDLPEWIDKHPYNFDRHFARQFSFIPEGSRIFRLEEGLSQVIPYLDGLAGNADGARRINSHNVGTWRQSEAVPQPTRQTLEILAQVYAEDFARFGYKVPMTAEDTKAIVDLSDIPQVRIQPAKPKTPSPPKVTLARRIRRALLRASGQK